MILLKYHTLKYSKRHISYLDYNSNSDNDITLVCFSGAASDSYDWIPFCTKISAKGYRIIIIDKPGFLLTDLPYKNDFFNQVTEDVFNVLQSLKVNSIFLIGHSIGFLSALMFAENYRDSVNIKGICSLDGLALTPANYNLMNKIQPNNFFKSLQKATIIHLRLFRKHLTTPLSEYPKPFEFVDQSFKNLVQKQRLSRQYAKAILKETYAIPSVLKENENTYKESLALPLLLIKADENNEPEEQQNDSQLQELLNLADKEEKEWHNYLLKKNLNSEKKIIKASHFLHGEEPEIVSNYIINFIFKHNL